MYNTFKRGDSVITTVRGSLKEEDLGITMMHEHLVPHERIPEPAALNRFVEPLTVQVMIKQLEQAKRWGLCSIVDCTPYRLYRNPQTLLDISTEVGVNVIAATGFYTERWIPAFAYRMTIDEIAAFMLRELREGIGDTGIRAGIIKVASSKMQISPVEERVIRAAARAHRETGAPITTHATLGTMGVEQVQILEEEGADLQHVVIGHSGLNESLSYCEKIIKHGAYVGFDTIGKERFDYVRLSTAGVNRFAYEKEAYHIPDQRLIERITSLVKAGYESRIVLSSDITRNEAYINPDTLGSWGYTYLLGSFVPSLKEAGISEEVINQMVLDNPQRFFTTS